MKFASLKCMVWFLKQYCQTSTTLHIPSNDFQGRIAHCGLPCSKWEKLPRNRAAHYAHYGNETTVWYFHLKQLHAMKIVYEIRNSHLWTPTVLYTIPSSMCSGLLWTQPVTMNINRIFNWWTVTGDWNECMETSICSVVLACWCEQHVWWNRCHSFHLWPHSALAHLKKMVMGSSADRVCICMK